MRPPRPLTAAALPLVLVALAAAGCGSGGSTVGGGNRAAPVTPAGVQQAAFDPRDEPLGCLHAKGIEAQKDAKETDKLDILPATSGASVQFASTPAQAQDVQLRNGAPGAEVIGPHLLTVGDLSDDELGKIETCLQAQGSRY